MSNYCEEDDEGFHFHPDDNELIKNYLIPKISGKPCEDFIVMKNVYAKEPWLLDHNMDPFFQKNEWYYFVTRAQVSKKKIGCGKKVKRKITGDNTDGIDRGNWKANSSEDIIDKYTGKIIGTKQILSFKKSNNNNNKKRKIGYGTVLLFLGSDRSWIMKEYMLPEGENFQELVLCKLQIKKSKKKDDHHEASTSNSTYHESSSSEHDHHEASTSTHMNVPLARIGDNSNEDEE